MIHIDFNNSIFKIDIPTNEKELEILRTESLIVFGSFLEVLEKKKNKPLTDKEVLEFANFSRVIVNMARYLSKKGEKNDYHDSKSKRWQWQKHNSY